MILNPRIENSKEHEIKVIFPEMDHGFCNLLKKELWSNKETESAGFRVTHPEVGEIEFFLKTKGNNPKKVWNEAVDSLLKKYSLLK